MATPFPLGPRLRRQDDERADQSGVRMVLASGSPRRRELLGQLGIEFAAVSADIDETPRPGESARELVRRLSLDKAVAVAASVPPPAIVLGADTAVEIDGRILGKPIDGQDARRMLRLLSGRTHRVRTAVTVLSTRPRRLGPRNGRPSDDLADHSSASTCTDVTFVELSDAMIDWYVDTGEPDDKAGGYGLQGLGGLLVDRVNGSVSGVLGLPMDVVVRLLRDAAADRTTDGT